MGAEKDILEFLGKNLEGASISDIADATGHTRATAAKYLELMKLQNKVDYREIGKTKLWVLTGKRKRILIAEDEDHIRRLVKVILEQDNYDFVEAKDGKDALEKVSEHMPDLIILDLMMPKIDGIEVCEQLKKNALTRKIPVIMLTAKREMSDKVVGTRVGADDYLTKPFEPRELRVRVRTFLDKEKRERNPITNLPTFEHVASKLKNLEKNLDVYYLFFKNLVLYKKYYGFSKTNELIRLTSQIITHILERFSTNNFVGHDDENNFILAVENNRAKNVLKEIKNEFESTIPFFYDMDYENIDFKNDIITKLDSAGKIEKLALIQLDIKQLKREDINKDNLNKIRGE
ncbi:response regulator [Candidatus Woesearchaeota archaeon]|nr:response regulator [Candidatus Woesearchaeota archaeon]